MKFSYHPAGSAEQIFFSQQQKKIENHALTVLNYHPYGFYVVFCENVSLGAPVTRPLMQPLGASGLSGCFLVA